ncbi:BTB/POZ domain-containing protein [Aspergillus undulatus]|uniref:BTB/POZ domain-containing protein n=1 Tax=Aspergillus undulatus TaxID=1810928 RepID=UPI003CCCCB87
MANGHTLPYFSFLDSDIVILQATETGRPFRIHRALLASTSTTIASAFDRGFAEARRGTYIFSDTSEGTLARFIEWAYTGDYPAIIKTTHNDPSEPLKFPLKWSESYVTRENHPLLSHIRLYKFCDLYTIPDLQDLAYTKTTETLTEINQPTTLDTQLAVIAALRFSFRRLPPNDRFLDWLSQYASYNITHLRVQRDFHDLLSELPSLGSRMVLSMNPAKSPPWSTQPAKYKFAHYDPEAYTDEEP